jgi:GNAT superfamily N-acetyltransferase
VEHSGEVTIRPARREDAPAICVNNRATAEETEGRILDPSIAWKGVNALFDDPSRGFYLVAEREDQVIGQCMITYEWSDWRCGNFWWIQSVFVVPQYRRTGIFSEIFKEIFRLAQKHPEAAGLRLYVAHSNINAMKVYASLGMHESRYVLFEQEFQDFPLK